MRVLTVIAAAAALLSVLLTVGFQFDIDPLDMWTYPVASVLAIIAVVAGLRARAHGMRVNRAGGDFNGALSLASVGVGAVVLFFTFFPSLMYVLAQFR